MAIKTTVQTKKTKQKWLSEILLFRDVTETCCVDMRRYDTLQSCLIVNSFTDSGN